MPASQAGSFNIQEFTDAGVPLVGGRIYTYAQGTTTHKTVYTDRAGEVPHTYVSDGLGGQYVALNARGELPAPLYLAFGSYDICLKTASGATVWTRRADPTLQSESASISDFGAVGNGIADDSDAFALAAIASNYVHVPSGSFRITRPLNVPNLRSLAGAPGAKIILDKSIGYNFAFTRNAGTIDVDVTTINTTAANGDTSITVADASMLSPGMRLRLKSSEYFHGLAGIPGFGIYTKGEYIQITQKVGNVLTLAEPLRDKYLGATYPVGVSIKTFGESLEVSGLEVVYDGSVWGDEWDEDSVPEAAQFFAVRNVLQVSIHDNKCYNMPTDAFYAGYCMDVQAQRNHFEGPDLTRPDNLPMPGTRWAKGLNILSCQGVSFTGNTCRNLRRSLEAATATGDVICRDIINSHNSIHYCTNMVGGHTFENYTAIGNIGTADDLAYMRGKNVTLIGNTCQAADDYFSSLAIGIGGGANLGEAYEGDYSNGTVIIKDNRVMGNFGRGIQIRGSVDSLTSEGNWIGKCQQFGIVFASKNLKNIIIRDTYRGVPDNVEAEITSLAVAILNTASLPVETIDGVTVDVTTSGKFYRGIGIPGTATGTGARRIHVDGSFEHLAGHIVVFGPTTGDILGEKGFFDGAPLIGSIRCGNTDGIMGISPAGEGGCWPISSQYMGFPGSYSHELAYYDGETQGGTTPGGSSRTYLRGARRNYYNPTAGSYVGQVCLTSGTSGTLAGCTGTIAAGSSLLTINDASLVSPGAFISIAGSGIAGAALAAQVVAKTGAVLTLNIPAETTVAAAAVTWTPSVWRGYGLIAA